MRFYLKEHRYYCEIDLHSKQMYVISCKSNRIGILDRFPNEDVKKSIELDW